VVDAQQCSRTLGSSRLLTYQAVSALSDPYVLLLSLTGYRCVRQVARGAGVGTGKGGCDGRSSSWLGREGHVPHMRSVSYRAIGARLLPDRRFRDRSDRTFLSRDFSYSSPVVE
jgi:hypothetical protein